jgi:hypothetical protein
VGSVRPGNAQVGERTCFRFKAARESGTPLAGALVKLSGTRARTGAKGRARICKSFSRAGVRHARITKRRYEKETLRIKVR